ncbi:MAG TPA: MlaE family lipid ABC transporter permease subunit [Kofleriaceae bacterium]|nr:MlaE family lipid ABC transporter permease subunit [Kofleriaceae bacterium]
MSAWTIEQRPGRIALAGQLRIDNAAAVWRALQHATRDVEHAHHVEIDLGAVSAIDSTIIALLVELRAALATRGTEVEISGASQAISGIVHLYGGDRAPAGTGRFARQRSIARLGSTVASAWAQWRRLVEFCGELARGIAATVRHPSLGGWRELGPLVARAGADGVPIVLVLDFLVGFVMAYQSTRQLQTYGANLYVADIVGISMTRELAPLITAIIISGRSGAGFAAELGTMRVGEEIDALRTMGIAPVPYLVVPRVVALALVAPVLALVGDIAGVAGGLVVGATSLDVHPHAYLAELRAVVVASDVWTGLVKSFAFGIAIAVIGCQQGLGTRGAASGVGRSTTTTVVVCLFTLVAIDTGLTMVFRGVGL